MIISGSGGPKPRNSSRIVFATTARADRSSRLFIPTRRIIAFSNQCTQFFTRRRSNCCCESWALPEGATTGAVSGATVGGVLGLLAGIGALAIPGVGPFIAAGPIMATLAGMGVGGAVGGLTGALIGMGIPEFEAKKYEGRLKRGGNPFLGALRHFRASHAGQGNTEEH
jgi:hypothetical protein